MVGTGVAGRWGQGRETLVGVYAEGTTESSKVFGGSAREIGTYSSFVLVGANRICIMIICVMSFTYFEKYWTALNVLKSVVCAPADSSCSPVVQNAVRQ